MSTWTEEDAKRQTIAIKDGEVYRVIGYQPNPTVIFENVKTEEQEQHAINAMNIKDFRKLVFETGSEPAEK